MKRRTIFSLAIMFGLFLALFFSSGQVYGQPLSAPIDTSFTYQGRLVSGGVPANGTYDFTFTLYDALNGGAQVGGTVIWSGVVVTDGLFTVQLDLARSSTIQRSTWRSVCARAAAALVPFFHLARHLPPRRTSRTDSFVEITINRPYSQPIINYQD